MVRVVWKQLNLMQTTWGHVFSLRWRPDEIHRVHYHIVKIKKMVHAPYDATALLSHEQWCHVVLSMHMNGDVIVLPHDVDIVVLWYDRQLHDATTEMATSQYMYCNIDGNTVYYFTFSMTFWYRHLVGDVIALPHMNRKTTSFFLYQALPTCALDPVLPRYFWILMMWYL